MPLPPAGHPARPVYLASREMLLLGILTLLLGSCSGFFAVFAVLQAGRYATGNTPSYGPPTTAQYLYAGAFVIVLLTAAIIAMGTTLLVCAQQILQRKRWAITAGLVTTCVIGTVVALTLLLSVLEFVTEPGSRLIARMVAPGVQVVVLALCVQLVVHLSKSYRGIEMMRGLPVDMRGTPVATQDRPSQ